MVKEIKKAEKLVEGGKMAILDTFWLSNECYLGLIQNPSERERAKKLCAKDRKELLLPNLIVYLKASPSTIRKFMKSRERSFENKTAFEQALEINREHNKLFTTNNFPNLIIINRNNLDFNKKEHFLKIIRAIN